MYQYIVQFSQVYIGTIQIILTIKQIFFMSATSRSSKLVTNTNLQPYLGQSIQEWTK